MEAWLAQLAQHIDPSRFAMDALVWERQPSLFDTALEAAGVRIIETGQPDTEPLSPERFHRILEQHGPYNILHAHWWSRNGAILPLAKESGIRVRIVHSRSIRTDLSLPRLLRLALRRRRTAGLWTAGLAVSRPSALSMFGLGWERDPRIRVLYGGIDLSPFRQPVNGAAFRAELGLPADALVIGHVGRFSPEKNHAFLVDIAALVTQREPRAHVLCVGEGPLLPAIRRQVDEKGLGNRFHFQESRGDIPRLLRGAVDVMALPSLREGLPRTGLEAQAAGRLVVVSDVVTPEMDVAPELVRRLSLRQPAGEWAATLVEALRETPAMPPAEALARLEASPFNVLHSTRALEDLYETLLARAGNTPDR